jgi:CDP-diglyceride synthetase
MISRLSPWMVWVLRVAAVNNLLAGLSFMVFYHESFKLVGLPKPEVKLPIQLTGIFVFLFGIGYYWTSRHPAENRNVLLLGFLSKLFGSTLAVAYVLMGRLPWIFIPVVLVADIAYLPPFLVILRHLRL